jgi:formamidopyrimidine-DNA glycosylase
MELPELVHLAAQLEQELPSRTIDRVAIGQPKCLNVDPAEMIAALTGARIANVRTRGKWIVGDLSTGGHLLLNVGMGADVFLYGSKRDRTTEDRVTIELGFADGCGLTIRFWWFGHFHLVGVGKLEEHTAFAGVGPSPLSEDFTPELLAAICARRRTPIKTVILDQKLIGGIGNVYGQDPLFYAGIHPLQPAKSLTRPQIEALHESIRRVLTEALDLGGHGYERDLYGNHGGYTMERVAVAYKDGKPCPTCGTTIVKLKTGSTTTCLCEQCQPLKPWPVL